MESITISKEVLDHYMDQSILYVDNYDQTMIKKLNGKMVLYY